MEKIKQKEEPAGEREESVLREMFLFLFFLIFAYFSDLRKSDHRFSSGLKAKLIYAMRATCGHQKVGISTNFAR